MLVITRRIGESFTIGDDITVTLLDKHGSHQIKIGIEAPKEIKILRSELVDHDDIRKLIQGGD